MPTLTTAAVQNSAVLNCSSEPKSASMSSSWGVIIVPRARAAAKTTPITASMLVRERSSSVQMRKAPRTSANEPPRRGFTPKRRARPMPGAAMVMVKIMEQGRVMAIEPRERLRRERFDWLAETRSRPVHAENGVRMAVDEMKVVGNEEERELMFVLEPVERLVDLFFARDVHARRWLVEEQDIRLADQGECDHGALELPRGQLAQVPRQDGVLEPHGGSCPRHILLSGARNARFGVEEVTRGKRQLPVDVEFLRNIADLRLLRPAYGASVRNGGEERTEERGFAGTVGADDGERLAALDKKRDVLEHDKIAERDVQVLDVKDLLFASRALFHGHDFVSILQEYSRWGRSLEPFETMKRRSAGLALVLCWSTPAFRACSRPRTGSVSFRRRSRSRSAARPFSRSTPFLSWLRERRCS